MYIDRSDEFWPPAGWMTWFCWILGAFDLSLFILIIRLATRN